jgi:hypothetical protein
MDTKPESPENKMITFSIPQHVDFAKIERTTQKKRSSSRATRLTSNSAILASTCLRSKGIILCIRCSLTTENNYNNVFF